MRSREEITEDIGTNGLVISRLQLEVLLDIRDLLQSLQNSGLSNREDGSLTRTDTSAIRTEDTKEQHKEIQEHVDKDFAKSEEKEQ